MNGATHLHFIQFSLSMTDRFFGLSRLERRPSTVQKTQFVNSHAPAAKADLMAWQATGR